MIFKTEVLKSMILKMETLKVRQEALKLNEGLYRQKKREVEIGTLAPVQLANIEADIASKESDIITANKSLIAAEIRLKKSLNIEFLPYSH